MLAPARDVAEENKAAIIVELDIPSLKNEDIEDIVRKER